MGGVRITDTFQILETGEIAGNASATAMPALKGAKWAKFKAQADNAGKVYIGIVSGLTKAAGTEDRTTGWGLSAGEETDWLPVPGGNLSGFYRICDNAGDDLMYVALS